MSLWKERFSPTPMEVFQPSRDDFNKAWNWMFEKDESGAYQRAGLVLIVVRAKCKELRRQGVVNPAKMATVATMRLYCNQMAVIVPKRRQ